MTALVAYEREVVRSLVSPHLAPDALSRVMDAAELVSHERSGSGYYLTIRHAELPQERCVCREPILVGSTEALQCGFVVFLEDGTLTLECHAWGDAPLPDDLRDRELRIERAG